jgi:hypothetical protein
MRSKRSSSNGFDKRQGYPNHFAELIAGYAPESLPENSRAISGSAIAVFNNQLVAFIIGFGNQVYYRRMRSDWYWEEHWQRVPGNFGTGFSKPSVTVFNGRLVVLATSRTGRIYITQADTNWSWNTQWTEVPGNAEAYDIASTVFNQRLVVLATGSSDKRVYITQTDKDWNWNTQWTEVPGNGRTRVAPAVTVFNNIGLTH